MKNMRYECAYRCTHKHNDNKIEQQTKRSNTTSTYKCTQTRTFFKQAKDDDVDDDRREENKRIFQFSFCFYQL